MTTSSLGFGTRVGFDATAPVGGLNELFKAHPGLIVFRAMRFEPFMVIVLAKAAQKIEDRLELRHENRSCAQALDNFHFMLEDGGSQEDEVLLARLHIIKFI